MPFARTKIQPPQPRGGAWIERPALETQISSALLGARVVLLRAPAGYGKTLALTRALRRLPAGTAVAWVGCDGDDTPIDLLEALVAALEPYDLPWRTAPEALVRQAFEAADSARQRAIAAEIVNALEAADVPHGVIAVDDLHRVAHDTVFRFLDLLLERFGTRWTLAIASRSEPPIALPRLRAQGELVEFGAEQLAFGRDEARRLAATRGVDAAAAERLRERCAGWPAGLRLGLAAPARAGTIDRHVFDFLTAEVIDELDPALRDFLLVTSVLPELTPERCAAVSGDAAAAERLDAIARAGLFATVVDEAAPTLRLHDLFREALEARLARETPALLRRALQRAAASEPLPLRRVAWLQRAEAWDEAEALLDATAEGQIALGAAATVRALFEAFPAARRDRSPRLKMLVARMRWDWDNAVDATAQAATAFAASGEPEQQRRALSYHAVALAGANRHAELRHMATALLADPALGGAALARTLVASAWIELARGDQRTLAPLIERMLSVLEAGAPPALWLECAPLGPFVGLPGLRAPLQRYVDAVLLRAPEEPTPLRGVALILQSWLRLWRGDVAGAEASAQAAADDSRWLGAPAMLDAPSRSLRAVLQALRGDAAGGLSALRAVLETVEQSGAGFRREVYGPLYVYLAMRIAALAGDRATLREMALRLAEVPDAGRSWLSPAQRAGAAAHLALLDGDAAAASARWQALLDAEFSSDLYGQVADTRLRLADTLRQQRQEARAAAVLQPLFERIGESGEWGAALLAGPALLARLAAHEWRGALAPAQAAALRDWAAAAARALQHGERAPSAAAAAAPLLTSREGEVLAAIAAGDSNKLIARRFELSPHTVKRHVANILDKLGCESRGQAAAWFRRHAH